MPVPLLTDLRFSLTLFSKTYPLKFLPDDKSIHINILSFISPYLAVI